ncbi:MAG: aldehyde dehydrogenase [Beutenbergiaceae bacterium]
MHAAQTTRFQHYIGGRYQPPHSGQWFPSTNPYTGQVWAEIARGDGTDVDRAVAAARDAAPGWSRTPASERGRMLLRLADALELQADALAALEVRDNGKLLAEMRGQMHYLPSWYRYYAGLADKVEGGVIPMDKPGYFTYTTWEALGVVGIIVPWNSPLLLLGWKLAPALAAGNTVVIKPSEFTSASALEFMKIIEQAGIPDGVVNVVTGFGAEAGQSLVDHPDVAKIAFTGSDATGRDVYQQVARGIKRVTLELGGKSPNIVFADADLDEAIDGVISGIFAATGQTCLAGSRLLVQDTIHDAVIDRLTEVAQAAVLGDPMQPATQVGPIATEPQYRKVLQYLDIGLREGARPVAGGRAATTAGGWFIQPTVFTDVTNDMRIAREEIFGPVLSVLRFTDEAEALAIANDTPFGLAAGVWTTDLSRAFRMADGLQAGTVWVNTYRASSYLAPFGGYKQSGFGREGGSEMIKEYLQSKTVWMNVGAEVVNPFVQR